MGIDGMDASDNSVQKVSFEKMNACADMILTDAIEAS